MTAWDLLAIAARRWMVTLSSLLLLGLAVFWVTTVPPVYSAHVRVVLLPPTSSQQNGYAFPSKSLINLAGVVAREIRGVGNTGEAVSDSVTLASEGYREGYEVRHPNAGSQWEYQFTEPVLDVQAVGATQKDVEKQMTLALRLVESTLAGIQSDQGVAPANRVRTSLNPPAPQFREEDGSRGRAIGATMLIGIILTLVTLGSLGPKRTAGTRRSRDMTAPSAGQAEGATRPT